jgi:type I restriction enzyme S subunit
MKKVSLGAVEDLRAEERTLGIKAGEFPFEVPKGWVWCRLGDILQEKPRNGISLKPVGYKTKAKSLKLSATTSGSFDGSQYKYLDVVIEDDSFLWLKDGDLLIQRANSLEFVGTAAIYRGPEKEFIYPDLMMKCRAVFDESTPYLHRVLSARITQKYFQLKASGSAGNMPKINQKTVINLLVPLPPLAEQIAIESKIRAIFSDCSKLEAELASSRREMDSLHKSVLRETFSMAT